jgi:hypothetical protein
MLPLGKCPHGKPKIKWTNTKMDFRGVGFEGEKLMELAPKLHECPQNL